MVRLLGHSWNAVAVPTAFPLLQIAETMTPVTTAGHQADIERIMLCYAIYKNNLRSTPSENLPQCKESNYKCLHLLQRIQVSLFVSFVNAASAVQYFSALLCRLNSSMTAQRH
jgi:hypothetical protein